jgi:hypothetical protein
VQKSSIMLRHNLAGAGRRAALPCGHVSRIRSCVLQDGIAWRADVRNGGAKGCGRPYGGKFMRRRRSWERWPNTASPRLRPRRAKVPRALKSDRQTRNHLNSSSSSFDARRMPRSPAMCVRSEPISLLGKVSRGFSFDLILNVTSTPAASFGDTLENITRRLQLALGFVRGVGDMPSSPPTE